MATATASAPVQIQIRQRDAFISFSHAARWEILKILATGKSITPEDMVPFASSAGMARKHLRAMHAAGIVASVPDKDGRKPSYFIPKQFLTEPGVVDYGFCRLRFVS
jgi:hypothetical protein